MLLAGCAAFAAVLAFSDLGARPLISPAEARYALVAREMAESGDWIQPRFNHVRFYEKPPLTFWCVGASYRLFGFTEFASRLPSALAYVGTTALTVLLALELLGAGTAPLAGLIFATSLGPFLFGRFLFTDTMLVFCLTLSLLGLAKLSRGRASPRGAVLFYFGAALAGLAKGLIGLLFPFATAAVYALLVGRRPFLRRLRPGLGAAILAVVLLPWHVALALRDPDFLPFYFGHEQFARFLSQRFPVNFVALSVPEFWISTLLWLFPWILFLPLAFTRGGRSWNRRLALVWIWVGVIMVFFTLTGSRMEYYALPAFPAIALIIGSGWRRFVSSGRRPSLVLVPASLLAILGLAVLPLVFGGGGSGQVALTRLITSMDGYYREYFASRPGAAVAFGSEILRLARPFPFVLLFLGVSTLLAVLARRRRLAFVLCLLGIVPILELADGGMRIVGGDRSQRAAAAVVERDWTPGSRLVVVGDYEESCGITFYTGRPTQVYRGPGSDMLFGYEHGDSPKEFLSEAAFQKSWNSADRVFVLGGRDLTLPGARVLFDGPRSRLLVNASSTTPSARPAGAP
ncbi:MAG TPA: glycosyltransferase family 39 protein [Thermoanaerobaculia bacterium]